MSYAEKNLSKGDSILLKANTSWLAVIPKLLVCIILCIIGLSMAEASVSLTVTFIVIAAVVLLGAVLKIKNTELALSRKKLIGRLGTFSIKTMDSPLNKINNVPNVNSDVITRPAMPSNIKSVTSANVPVNS